jgi:HAD superfamily hydrolase (TIGR01509 family)
MARALIFDFDGVIADSETLANTVLAETVTGLGLPTTLDDALSRYQGRRWPEALELMESGLGRPLPSGFSDDLKAALLRRFQTELSEVAGATDFIRHFSHLPKCIASSSSFNRLQLCLDVLALSHEFGENVFSADMVERGKPHPDIFLFAAKRIGVAPSDCIVIEDSASGVRAGVAAGMIVIGLCAGSHLRDGHAQRLREAGGHHIADTWIEATKLVVELAISPCRQRS